MQQASQQQIAALENEVRGAMQRGDDKRAAQLWERLLEAAPRHPHALRVLGQRAFRAGDLQRAHALLSTLVEVDGRDPQHWINLAVVCLGLKDEGGEEAAIHGALKADPMHLLGLILRANLYERQGKRHEAASAYGAVATVAPPLDRLAPELRPAVQQALAYQESYQREYSSFLDDYLAPAERELGGEDLKRFRESLDIMLGRKRRYDSQSALFHFHGLAPVTFFDRKLFPWLDAFEANTGVIRDEFLAVLAEDNGFTPYLQYRDDQPLNQWAELNQSLRWSAFHLIEEGTITEPNAARCPRTMELLAGAPQPQQSGRTPVAMFSMLKPRTRIPPHCGVSNVRLVTHLPLIIPPGCGFRVGNDVREWVPGSAWVFDDTIEHEAWNDSEQLRAILMFDVWHPHLSEAERRMVTALSAGIKEFTRTSGGFAL